VTNFFTMAIDSCPVTSHLPTARLLVRATTSARPEKALHGDHGHKYRRPGSRDLAD
jgi:hypothetical protein